MNNINIGINDNTCYNYYGKVERVIDGDTAVCSVDLGFGIILKKQSIRLHGINTPETRTKDLVEKAAGMKAKEYVKERLKPGDKVIISSCDYDKRGKYGRMLAKIYYYDKNGKIVNLNDELLRTGLAEKFMAD